MPLYYGTKPEETQEHQEPPKLDIEILDEIQSENEHLAELIKKELIEIKHNKQIQTVDGAEIYHKLIAISKAIKGANESIDLIRARG